MGKASRKKRQKEFQAKSALKDKPLEAGETSAKWSLFNKRIVHLLLIAIIGLLVYSNTFHASFHFDDMRNISENTKLENLSNFWPPSGSRWFGFLTFALNYHLGGLNTIGYHIVNLSIHILNAILIYFLVVLTFRTPYFKVHSSLFTVHSKRLISHEQSTMSYEPSILIALFSALIFVSHPIQTQAVTYIVQRFTSLATMFYLLSLVMYIKWRLRIEQQSSRPADQRGKKKNYCTVALLLYCTSLLSAVLAMKTKEIAFTLPVIITIYEFMFFDRKIKKRLPYLIPILLTMLIIPLSLTGMGKPVGDLIGDVSGVTKVQTEMSRLDYLFTQFRVIVTYIRLLFLPINQNLDYDYPIYDSFFNPNVFLSFLFLLIIFGLGVYLFYCSRTADHNSLTPYPLPPIRYTLPATRLISFGILWFFITLSVESSIIPIFDVIFEHRVYLPSVGAIIVFTTAVYLLFTRYTLYAIRFVASRFSLTTVFSLLTTVIVVLSIATYQRNLVWQDEVSLWEDVVRKSPNKARGLDNLGKYYVDKRWLDTAIKHLQSALMLNPNYAEAYNNLGNAYWFKGLTDKAIEHYEIALRLNSDHPEAHNNLAVAYASKGLTDKAIEHFQISLNLKPDRADVHFNLGKIYLEKRIIDKARNEFEAALQIKPDDYEAQQLLNYISNLNKTDSLGIQ